MAATAETKPRPSRHSSIFGMPVLPTPRSLARLASWTSDRGHALRYTNMRGFGGPPVYLIQIRPAEP